MQKVEVSKHAGKEDQRLIVDGELWEESSLSEGQRIARFWGAALDRLAGSTISDLAAHFRFVVLSLSGAHEELDEWGFSEVWILLTQEEALRHTEIRFRIEHDDVEFWARPYSIADIATAVKEILAHHPHLEFEYWQEDPEGVINGFGVRITVPLDTTVGALLSRESDLKLLASLTKQELYRADGKSLTVFFEFPAPIKSACEQYLLYFVQFLRDLGIETEAALTEQTSRVLFSVTPLNEKQALAQIHEALEVYLQMPLAPDFSAAGRFNDPAVSQLQANVFHLRSQIVLAKAVLELKDATIDARNTEIAVLKEHVDLRTFRPGSDSRPKVASDTEVLVKGVVSVKKYDFKFLEIDFPETLRKLKRRW